MRHIKTFEMINIHDPYSKEIDPKTIERLVGVAADDIDVGLQVFKDEIGIDIRYKYIDDARREEVRNNFDIVKYDTRRLVLVVDIIHTGNNISELKENIEDRLNVLRKYHPFKFDIHNLSPTRIVIRIIKGEKIKPGESYKLSIGKIKELYKDILYSDISIVRKWYNKKYFIILKFYGYKHSEGTDDIDKLVKTKDLLLKINQKLMDEYDMRYEKSMSWNIHPLVNSPKGHILFYITLLENK